MKVVKACVLALLLAILAALFISRHTNRELPAERNAAHLESRSGEAMADLVADQLKGEQNILLVAHTPEGDLTSNPVETAFKERAKKHGLTVVDTRYVQTAKRLATDMQVDSLEAMALGESLTGLGEINAIVSLCGQPTGKISELEFLPPFFCLCDEGERVPELMKAKIIQAAYVPRRSIPDPKAKNDWFQLLYQKVLPETVEAVYADQGSLTPP